MFSKTQRSLFIMENNIEESLVHMFLYWNTIPLYSQTGYIKKFRWITTEESISS